MPGNREEDFERKNAFLRYDLYGHDPAQEHLPQGSWNLQFYLTLPWSSLPILCLSDLCLGVEKKIFKEIMQIHYMINMATFLHKNPCPGGNEIYNFCRPFLGHHYYIHVLQMINAWELRRFLKKHSNFTPKITSPLDRGSWNLQSLVSLPYIYYIPNLVKIGSVVLENKMFAHDGRRPNQKQ